MPAHAIVSYFRLLRPEQWIKNLFVLAPVLFAGKLLVPQTVVPSLLAMLTFCMASSAVYCINDAADAAADRQHPRKRNRPVASGAVSRGAAVTFAVALAAAALVVAFLLVNADTAYVLVAYLSVNVAYTFGIKYAPIADICTIALGFLLRLCAGALASDCHLSAWIVAVTFLLSLFLALGKRREDMSSMQEDSRRRIYSVKFIDSAMAVTGAAVIVSYFLYTLTPSPARVITSELFYLTGIPVTAGILRYIQICIQSNEGGNHPRLIVRDPVILVSAIVYFVMLAYFLYAVR